MNSRDNHVDHINHDPRDNRKGNLRVILPNENLKNRETKITNQAIEMYVGIREIRNG